MNYFEQVSDNWEAMNSHKGDYSDGDPLVYFIIITYADGETVDSVVTEKFKVGEDVGIWNGSNLYTNYMTGGANKISICPVVYERNVIELNVNHSSMYCYFIDNPSSKMNQWISQSDYRASDYKLEWKVKLYYN